MAPSDKRRAGAPPAEPPAKQQRGGAGRGQGKKVSPVNAKGNDSAYAPKRVQVDLAELLGKRTKHSPSPAAPPAALSSHGVSQCNQTVWHTTLADQSNTSDF